MATVLMSTLAVVRCGDKSLHRSWSGNDRRFDVAISYFGDDLQREFPEASFVHRGKGGKWDGLYDFFQQYPETLQAYDYFWFPDDDISASAADINRLLAVGQRYGLQVFQPSLDSQSYYSHLITLQHPSFDLRFTNFVEIMVPVVSKAILLQTLGLLKETKSGFGMDFLWPRLASENTGSSERVAIIDSVTVCHTRPVGGSLHTLIRKAGGNTANDELAVTLGTSHIHGNALINGVAVPRIHVLSGLDRNGLHLSGARLSIRIARDLIGRYINKVQPVRLPAAIKHALKAFAPA